jgi:multiple sugar transport system permease protein
MATPVATKKPKRSPLEPRATTAWLFLAPALLGLLVFLVIPIGMALWVSFRNWSGITSIGNSNSVGLKNFNDLLIKPNVYRTDMAKSIRNNFYFVLGVVPLQTILAFFLANVLNQRMLKGKSFFRTAFYFPSVTSSIAISFIFIFLFSPSGLVNAILQGVLPKGKNLIWLDNANGLIHNILGVFGVHKPPGLFANHSAMGLSYWDWLSGPSVTMCSIMILAIWTTSGTFMLIFLGGLQNISNDLDEAARIDGASSRQIFFRVTIPMMRPTIILVLTLGVIGTWQVFDQIYAISSGGPQKSTLTPAYLVYREGFNNSAMGRAAAVAFILFAVILVFTAVQRFVLRDRYA